VLKSLKNEDLIPNYIYYGTWKEKDYLVMELLGAEDISKLRNRMRNLSVNSMPLTAAAYLTRKMLDCIKRLHKNGYVHRDIKPSNFVRRSKSSTSICIVDFGIAKLVSKFVTG